MNSLDYCDRSRDISRSKNGDFDPVCRPLICQHLKQRQN